MLVQEESSWMGPLALQLEIAYRVGTARGERSQLSALGVSRADYFSEFGKAINRLIVAHRRKLEILSAGRKSIDKPASSQPQEIVPTDNAFKISRDESEPKLRWVDGTPEYSFYIYALFQLFPEARFIHIVRDVAAVVRSMLAFERTGGPRLVESEQHAYEYWLRTVSACLDAERAYGSEAICRLHHSDLIAAPEASLRRLLDFLGEPFEEICLGPLQKKINSSEVSQELHSPDPSVDSALIAAAQELNAKVMVRPEKYKRDQAHLARLEKTFAARATELAARRKP